MGPPTPTGWVPGLSIRVELGEQINVIISRALQYVDSDGARFVSHLERVRARQLEPAVRGHLIREAMRALRSDGVDLETGELVAMTRR